MAWKVKIKQWWDGKYTPWENEPNSGLFLLGGHTEHHWTAKVIRSIWGFLKKEYKWVIGTIIAVVAIITALR